LRWCCAFCSSSAAWSAARPR